MTGFGLARLSDGELTASVELRSVNHRHLDVKLHLPPGLERLLETLEAATRARIARGRIEATVDLTVGGARSVPRIDAKLAAAYRQALVDLALELGVEPEVTLDRILSMPGVIEDPEGAWPEGARALVSDVYNRALEDLAASREREGRRLFQELEVRISEVEELVGALSREVPLSIESRRARIEARLEELGGELRLDPARLAQEVAIQADRMDVTEELARLGAHVSHFREVASQPASGKKLDFLIQELAREANTLGQKSQSSAITHRVVELKSAIERAREQVQNVE